MDIEQVLVAVGHYNGDGTWCEAVIIAWTPGGKLEQDIEELTADDMLLTRDEDDLGVSDRVPKERGLWLWEGVPQVDGESDGLPPDESADCHLMVGGAWRRPTVADLVSLGAVGREVTT